MRGFIKCELREAPRYLAATVKVGTQEINTIVPLRFGANDPTTMTTTSKDSDIKDFLKEMFSNMIDQAEIVLKEE